jgi:hypothetical protein
MPDVHLRAAAYTGRMTDMQKYIIERTVPGASGLTAEQLSELAGASNAVLRDLGPSVQWVHSYVAGDKLYCVYHATDEAIIREHAKCGGFPIDTVTAVASIIDPTTARS